MENVPSFVHKGTQKKDSIHQKTRERKGKPADGHSRIGRTGVGDQDWDQEQKKGSICVMHTNIIVLYYYIV